MFVILTMNLSQRQDVLIQAYIEEKTIKFIENVKVHGYLSIQMYETLVKDLQSSSYYDIEITHDKLMYKPEYLNSKFTGKVMVYNECYYTDEIMEALFREGIYYMEKDDAFSVTIKNSTLSFGMAMFKSIMGSTYSQEITKVGRIRDAIKVEN